MVISQSIILFIRIQHLLSDFQADHMLKQSASRNQRAKGFKVKHAIQICVLLLVCVWLIYQWKQTYMNNNPAIQVSVIGRKGLIDSQVKEGNDEEQDVEKVDEEEPDQLEDLIDEDDKDERIGKVI
ncbi:unnamed protein product [Lactuca virosa]|uniref:Uncharacterized protein n=1 Tax=Lactuca virosa TaxID=75947 RepID=A0AAU9NPD3_9ASTR|nr:unnamed protein product [Lactuca virosa]